MSMNRRDVFKLATIAAATTLAGTTAQASQKEESSPKLKGKSKGKRVVIIGGGFGGLAAAKYIKKDDSSVEVVVLEKNGIFMACPYSNTYLGEIEGVSLKRLTHDLYSGAKNHGYEIIQTTVTDIDRKSKVVSTTSGALDYDILVLSPGIAYDYKGQFPKWSDEKIRDVSQNAPAAMIAGSEHLALKRMLEDMDGGNVIITKPAGKYRCPPAPFERASMIAHFMEKEEIPGKVIILNANESIAKGAAFKESWKEINKGKVEHRNNCDIQDVDMSKGTITYKQEVSEDKYETVTEKFAVLNLIPKNMASPVTKMSGLKLNAWGGVHMNGASFQSKTDKNVYAIGDVVGHALPPSGQTANWTATMAAREIVAQLNGKKWKMSFPYRSANVCYSVVGADEAIMVTHDMSFNGKVIKGKGSVPKPKDGNGKFRSKGVAKLADAWFDGIMNDMFI